MNDTLRSKKRFFFSVHQAHRLNLLTLHLVEKRKDRKRVLQLIYSVQVDLK